jgi:hypothetical protein
MRLAFSASILMVICAPPVAAQVRWVPLNQANQGPKKKPAATTVVEAPPAQASMPAPAPPVQAAPPEAEQTSAAAVAPSVGNQPLQITCMGGGTANKPTSAFAWGNSYASGNYGSRSWSGSGFGSATIVGTRQQGFGDQVDIRLFSGDDRIRMPRTMLPMIHGGNSGWFKLKNVVADARSIRASAAVGLLNNPKVFIDRVTGTISISGKSGDYSGQCQAVEADATAKF